MVVMAVVRQIALFGQPAQPLQAVEMLVDRARIGGWGLVWIGCVRRWVDQVALLDHKEKEQPIDQAQQLLVVKRGAELAIGDGGA